MSFRNEVGSPCPRGCFYLNHIPRALPETNISFCDWGFRISLIHLYNCWERKDPYQLRASKSLVPVLGNIRLLLTIILKRHLHDKLKPPNSGNATSLRVWWNLETNNHQIYKTKLTDIKLNPENLWRNRR